MSEVQPLRFCGVLCISRSSYTYTATAERCFSAVAELLVFTQTKISNLITTPHSHYSIDVRNVCRPSVRLSVRPSVTFKYRHHAITILQRNSATRDARA